MQDFYLEDILKFIGYTAPEDPPHGYADSSRGKGSALSRLQTATVEQAIMDAFLKGEEGCWQRLLQVTGAEQGGQDTALINVTHPATGDTCTISCLHVLAS